MMSNSLMVVRYLSFTEKLKFYLLLVAEQFLCKTSINTKIQKAKGYFFLQLAKKYKSLNTDTDLIIDSINDLKSEDFKKNYYANSLPVVFKGAAKEWPCCQKWNLEYFNKFAGEKEVLLVDVEGLTTKKKEKNFELLSVKDLVSNINQGGDKYLRFSPLIEQHQQLSSEINLEWLNSMKPGGSIGNTYYLFMGGKGTVTHLHSDQPCNLFIQVYGRKKWTLIPVEDSHLVYPQTTQTAYFKSEVNLSEENEERFPLFNKVRKWEIILEPGDVLYVPPHVWHHVENMTDTIGVGYRFSSIGAAVKSSGIFTFLRVLAQNPPMWKSRKYGKIDTNLIWADANGSINDVLKQFNINSKGKK